MKKTGCLIYGGNSEQSPVFGDSGVERRDLSIGESFNAVESMAVFERFVIICHLEMID